MSKQTFLIALTTTEIPASETEYSIGAAKMAEIFDSIFMDRGVIGKLTKAATLSACHTEVEVSMGESGLVGRRFGWGCPTRPTRGCLGSRSAPR